MVPLGLILVSLFSFKMSHGKKQRNRQKGSPRSRKKKSRYVGEGSQQKGGNLNNWTTEDMANARALYNERYKSRFFHLSTLDLYSTLTSVHESRLHYRLDLYKSKEKANATWCAKQFGIPKSTFHNRVSDCPSSRKIKSNDHISGGARHSKIFSGKFISSSGTNVLDQCRLHNI